MRQILIFLACFWCILSFSSNSLAACPPSKPTSDPNFCSTFRDATTCRCIAKFGKSRCKDMNMIYKQMIDFFKSIENACKWEKETSGDTTVELCVAQWNFYFHKPCH